MNETSTQNRELRQRDRVSAIPIILCTANEGAFNGTRQELEHLGVPLVLKPFRVEVVAQLLSRAGGPG